MEGDNPASNNAAAPSGEHGLELNELYLFISSSRKQLLQDSSTSDNSSSQGLPWHIDYQEVALGKTVATGSFGVVYEGIYNGEKVAVKTPLITEDSTKKDVKRLKANFRKEIDLLYSSSHPNIVPFIGAYVGPPKWAMVTEFQHGGSLRSYLLAQQRKGLKLPLQVIHAMALDIARGMQYLHQNSIMHRDLKSANLLLDKSGNVKVTDFGLSRYEAQDAADHSAETGTIRWMAPEVIRGEPYTKKADVYSYGIVLWELCTCLLPSESMTFFEIADAVAYKHHRPSTSGVPPPFVYLVIRCWHKDPMKRPHFSEIVKYLEGNVFDDTKKQSRTKQNVSMVEERATGDANSRPTTSRQEGHVSRRKRNVGPSSSPKSNETLADDEGRVSRGKLCRCSMM